MEHAAVITALFVRICVCILGFGKSLLRSVPPYVSLPKSLPDSDRSVLSFLNYWQLQCSNASTDIRFVLVHPRFGNILVEFFIYWVHGSLGLIGWGSLYRAISCWRARGVGGNVVICLVWSKMQQTIASILAHSLHANTHNMVLYMFNVHYVYIYSHPRMYKLAYQ